MEYSANLFIPYSSLFKEWFYKVNKGFHKIAWGFQVGKDEF